MCCLRFPMMMMIMMIDRIIPGRKTFFDTDPGRWLLKFASGDWRVKKSFFFRTMNIYLSIDYHPQAMIYKYLVSTYI